jgi:electron transfer flavoprotein alpha subunit
VSANVEPGAVTHSHGEVTNHVIGEVTNEMICVALVRHGQVSAGTSEACAEANGNLLLVGSSLESVDLRGSIPTARTVILSESNETSMSALALHIVRSLDEPYPHAIVFPASPDGRDLAALVAHRLQRPLYANAVRVLSNRVTTTRSAGRLGDDYSVTGPFVATLIPGTRGIGRNDLASSAPLQTRVSIVPSVSPSQATAQTSSITTTAILPPDPATMDLTEAARIVGGGQGLHTTERFNQLGRVGKMIGASMGGTRVASDAGWIPFERQIGTTGVIVKPSLYLAFAISGATQHTSGLGDPDHVISVNTDASCPMMAMADLAIVADANAVLDALETKLTTYAENLRTHTSSLKAPNDLANV